MKIEERIVSALSRVTMPQGSKDAIREKILTAAGEDSRMGRKGRINKNGSKAKRWMIAAAAVAAATVVAAVLAVTLWPSAQTEMAAVPAQTPAQTTQEEPAADQPASGQDTREGEESAGRSEDMAYLTNLVLADGAASSLGVPDTLAVYENVPIEISQEEMGAVEENAITHGWQNIDMDGSEHDGLYFIWSRDVKGDILQITEQEHHEMRTAFLRESGLADLLEEKGMTLNLDESDANGVVWSVEDGQRGSGFVRLWFEQGKIVGDCKIWAVYSRLAAQAETIPLSEAINMAFFAFPEGVAPDPEAEYIADDVRLIYISGIPIYEFHIPRPGTRGFYTAYALAVSESVIDQNETIKEAYAQFVAVGF